MSHPPQDRPAEYANLELLRTDVLRLSSEGQQLRRLSTRRDYLMILLAALMVALIALTSVLLARTVDTHRIIASNRERVSNTSENTSVIRDCTQPTGQCYQRNARNSQALVAGAVCRILVALSSSTTGVGPAARQQLQAAGCAPS